jgi:predicted Zn-dependent protease
MTSGSAILEADILVSADFPWSDNPSDRDFLSVLMHEVGHALGLSHVSDRKAVMAPVSDTPGPVELRTADVAVIRSLYPEYWR